MRAPRSALSTHHLEDCLRLPFRIGLAPEIVHSTMSQMLESLAGGKVYIDNIVIWGSNATDHPEGLRKILGIVRANNLKLNKDKCLFQKTETA